MRLFRKFNVFTMLLAVATVAFSFRLINVVTFKAQPASGVGMVMSAPGDGRVSGAPPTVSSAAHHPGFDLADHD